MPNKGLKLLYCKECNRRRYCTSIPIQGYNFEKVCSQGHRWIVKGITMERLNAMAKDTIINNINLLFNRDDIFFKNIK